MDGVEFRDYQDSDLEWVLGAMVESVKATLTPERLAASDHATLLADARKDFDRFHHHAEKPDHILVAWRGGTRIGLVWITMQMPVHEEMNSAWLLEIFVVPELRKKGLARELMKRSEEWAAAQGATEIWLNVGGGNQKALSLYESQGFQVETLHLCKKL